MGEARRLKLLSIENAQEGIFFLSSFKRLKASTLNERPVGYRQVLAHAGVDSFSGIWFSTSLLVSSILAIIALTLVGPVMAIAVGFINLIFFSNFILSWKKSLRRIAVCKDLPDFFANLKQLAQAGRTFDDSISGAVGALPHGTLKTELKFLREYKGQSGILLLGDRISGREIRYLVGGLLVLFSSGKPDLWQISEVENRVVSVSSRVLKRADYYRIFMGLLFATYLFCMLIWTFFLFSNFTGQTLEFLSFLQCVGIVIAGFFSEKILVN